VIKDSCIPRAGIGVFVATLVHKNTQITEYGGQVLRDLKRLPWMRASHFFSVTLFGDIIIDGRAKAPYTWRFFQERKQYASFVNASFGGKPKPNTELKVLNQPQLFVEPDGSEILLPYRVVLRATRDIQPGEELITYYGTDNCKAAQEFAK
jgi:SET domain-containing protein